MTIGTPRLCIVLVNTRGVRSDGVKDKVFHALVNPRIPLSDRQEKVFHALVNPRIPLSDRQEKFSRTCRVFSRLFTLNTPRYFLEFDCSLLFFSCTSSRLASACFGTFVTSLSNFWNYCSWLRITDEGSIPEMLIWSILHLSFCLKCLNFIQELCCLFIDTPQGQLPTLTVDGVVLPQSLAIARFVAREFSECDVFIHLFI